MNVASEHPNYAEFFCGGGMVRAALQEHWACAFANDIDPMKCAVYRSNWGDDALVEGDIADLPDSLLARPVDLYWASSPCQDFSLAGRGRGLSGERSGVFRHWVSCIERAVHAGNPPRILAFENVVGLLTRNKGRDFREVVEVLAGLGYLVGALEIDARHFLPQSRPRLFVICVRTGVPTDGLSTAAASGPFHTARLVRFHDALPKRLRRQWVWWGHPAVPKRNATLMDLLDDAPDRPWLSTLEIKRLRAMMSEPSSARMQAAAASGGLQVGTLYKRGRPDGAGTVRQRAEVRFDGVAGCLRTPAGGSSRQTVVLVEGRRTRARLLSTREVARLMGLPDDYTMPARYNDAYRVAGDGVAVPIVRYLDETLFQPLLRASRRQSAA